MNLRALARQYHQGTTDRAAYRKARAELIETALHDSGGDDTTGMNTAGVDTAPAATSTPTPAGGPDETDPGTRDSEGEPESEAGDADEEAISPDEATVVVAPPYRASTTEAGNPSHEAGAPPATPSGNRVHQRRLATQTSSDGYRRRLLVLTIVVAVLVLIGLTVDFASLFS